MDLYPLIITCPATSKDADTGFAMTMAAFDAATLTDVPLRCPNCGKTHRWSIEDARLEDRVVLLRA